MYNIVQVYRYRVAGYSLHYDGRSVSLEAVNIRSSISDELLVMGSRNICTGDRWISNPGYKKIYREPQPVDLWKL